MVCIPSRMGRMMRSAVWLRAPSTPTGRPMPTDRTTATTIKATVSIIGSQRPMNPMNRKAKAVKPVKAQRPTAKAASTRANTTAGQGSHFNPSSM